MSFADFPLLKDISRGSFFSKFSVENADLASSAIFPIKRVFSFALLGGKVSCTKGRYLLGTIVFLQR